MISAMAIDQGDSYTVRTKIKGNGDELEAETLAILRGVWRQKYGPMMINSILEDFIDWVRQQESIK